MNDTVAERIAYVRREIALMEASDEATRLAPRSKRQLRGSSVVFSVRLDPDEMRALDVRAALIGTKPSVLGDGVQDLRALVP